MAPPITPPPPGGTPPPAPPLQLSVYTRKKGESTPPACALSDLVTDDWHAVATDTYLGKMQCDTSVSAEPFILRKSATGDSVDVYAPGDNPAAPPDIARKLITLDHVDANPHFSARKENQGFSFMRFDSQAQLTSFYNLDSDKPDDLTTVTTTDIPQPTHPSWKFGVGVGGGQMHETDQATGLRGVLLDNSGDIFQQGGLTLYAQYRLPNHLFRTGNDGTKYTTGNKAGLAAAKMFINPTLHYLWLRGRGNENVAGETSVNESFAEYHNITLDPLVFRLSREMFDTTDYDWDLYFEYRPGMLEIRNITGHWTAMQHSNALEVRESQFAMFQTHQLLAGGSWPCWGMQCSAELLFQIITQFHNGDGASTLQWVIARTPGQENRGFAAELPFALATNFALNFGGGTDVITEKTTTHTPVTLANAPAPQQRQPLPIAPPPKQWPQFGTFTPNDQRGLRDQTIMNYEASKTNMTPESQASEIAKLRALYEKLKGLEHPELYEVRATVTASASSTGQGNPARRAQTNLFLSNGRAHGTAGDVARVAKAAGLPDAIIPTHITSIGVGETQLRDTDGQIIDRTIYLDTGRCERNGRPASCRQTQKTHDLVKIHKTKGGLVKRENLFDNQSAKIEFKIVPKSAPIIHNKAEIAAEQLARNIKYGPTLEKDFANIRSHRKPGAKFASAKYDPEQDRLYLSLSTLDEGDLKELGNQLPKIYRKQRGQVVSTPIEIVYTGPPPTGDFAEAIRKNLSDNHYREFPSTGGLKVTTQKSLTDFQEQVTRDQKRAAATRQLAHKKWSAANRAIETGFAALHFDTPADTAPIETSALDAEALYRAIKLEHQSSGGKPPQVLLVYNNPKITDLTKIPDGAKQQLDLYTFEVSDAKAELLGVIPVADPRLRRGLHVIFHDASDAPTDPTARAQYNAALLARLNFQDIANSPLAQKFVAAWEKRKPPK